MDGSAAAQQLALLARTGLMTHVAELVPPVTAEAVSRFRAEAATQASNVMGIAAGRFALCLPPGTREIETRVPHRLHPIARDGSDAARLAGESSAASAPAPEPTPPPRPETPGLRDRACEAPAPAREPDALTTLVEGQVAIAAGLDRLGRDIAQAQAAQAGSLADAVQAGIARALPAALEGLRPPAPQPAAANPRPDATAERLDLLETAARTAQARMRDDLETVARAIEALAARIETLEIDARRPAAPPETPDRPAATVTPLRVLGPEIEDAPPVQGAPGTGRDLPEGLDTMLQTILARLSQIARETGGEGDRTGPAGTSPQWQRSDARPETRAR